MQARLALALALLGAACGGPSSDAASASSAGAETPPAAAALDLAWLADASVVRIEHAWSGLDPAAVGVACEALIESLDENALVAALR